MKITASFLAILTAGTSYAFTLSTQSPRPYECPQCENLSHDALTARWALSKRSMNPEIKHPQKTHQFYTQATLEQLRQGLPLLTLGPEAVIKITPLQAENTISSLFFMKLPSGKTIALQEHALKSEEKYNELILSIKPEWGMGEFVLFSDKADKTDKTAMYQIEVMDRSANAYLSIETDAPMYVYGDQATVIVRSAGHISGYPIIALNAEISTPSGDKYPVPLTQSDINTYKGRAILLSETNPLGENWSVTAYAKALDSRGSMMSSQIRAAFSYAVPSAVVTHIQKTDSPMHYQATLNNATGSRYAINAVLVSIDRQGKQTPLEVVQTAAWLSPGEHQIAIQFSERFKKQAATLAIGSLEVIDYGQLRKVFAYRKKVS